VDRAGADLHRAEELEGAVMSESTSRWTIAGTVLGALLAGAAPAAADWLVLGDGGRVETRGPWEIRSGLVVFTLPNGTLSSVRATQVDLEASRAATEIAARPPEPPPPPPPKAKARVVLTERDLPPVTRPPASPEGEAGADAAGTERSDQRLRVDDWSTATPEGFDGTIVSGRLRNVSRQLLTEVGVEVALYNTAGELLGRRPATLPSGPVAPDRVVDFQVDFPGVFGASGARFETQALAFLEEGATGAGRTPEPARAASATHDPMDGAEAPNP
jgi:hypothetical protein